jgi:cytoskeleton protein RodZ
MGELVKPRMWSDNLGPEDSFGAWLRRQREVREISLREISEASKISIRYLEALEQNRFEVLPAPVFARGFLREYACYVGLDADEVINYYLAAQGASPEEDTDELEVAEVKSSSLGSWVVALLAGAAIVFIVVAALANYLNRDSPQGDRQPVNAAPPVPVVVTPTDSEPSPQAVPATAPLRVTLDFTQSCWVEAWVDAERTVSELRVQGESLRLEADEEIRVTLGNAAGAGIEVNGIRYEPPLADGEELRIDLDLANQLEGGS